MSKFSKDQEKLDALVKQRRIYKDALNFTTAPQTKDFSAQLVSRIEALRDEYIEKYDGCDPKDSDLIARFQEARFVCGKILLDFDIDVCKKAIVILDEQIKQIHSTMDKKKAAEKDISGFGSAPS